MTLIDVFSPPHNFVSILGHWLAQQSISNLFASPDCDKFVANRAINPLLEMNRTPTNDDDDDDMADN